MPLLTNADHAFFEQNGYGIVHDAVPPENLTAVVEAIFAFLGMRREDPSDWYRPPHRTNGMVELYHHPALWANRQHPKLHQVFGELYGTSALLVSEDRAGFKPPQHPDHPDYDHKGFTHWDVDTSKLPLPFRVQAVLCLTDTDESMGGFQCVPGFHRNLDQWIARQPQGRSASTPELAALPPGMRVTPIVAKAGDLIYWNTLLAHGNGHNVSRRPRLAQYITMWPAAGVSDAELAARIDRFNRRVPPPNTRAFPGDPRRLEELHGQPVQLSALGRKLLGMDRWDGSA